MTIQPLLTTEEVAEILRVSTRTITTLAERNDLQGVRVGRQWRFTQKAIEEFVQHKPASSSGEAPG